MTEKIKQTNKFNLDALSAKRVAKKPPGFRLWQKLLIAIASGSILALSTPGFDLWCLAWFMVAPFLVLLRFCQRNSESLLIGLCFGLSYQLVSLHYYMLSNATSTGQNTFNWQVGLGIWFLQAILLSLPTILFAWLVSALPLRAGFIPYFRRPFFPYLIAVPLLWVFLHWGLAIAHPLSKFLYSTSLPVMATNSLVYSQYNVLALLQVLKYIGPIGLEFLLIVSNAVIAACIFEFIKTQEGPVERVDAISPRAGALIDLAISVLLIGLVFYYGRGQISNYITQNNGLIEYDRNNELAQPVLPVCITNTNVLSDDEKSLNEKQVALVILTTLNENIKPNQVNSFLNKLKTTVQQNKNSVLLNYTLGEKLNIVRHSFLISPTNSLDIKQPISCPEAYIMLSAVFGKNKALSDSLPLYLQNWFSNLPKQDPSSWYSLGLPKISWGKIGLLSGADIIDFRLVANEVRKGASLIIDSTNLDLLSNPYLNRQLLAAAIFRAIENNRYILFSTGRGVKAIIEPSGAVQCLDLSSTATKQNNNSLEGNLLGTVQFRWSKTLFTKTWWL